MFEKVGLKVDIIERIRTYFRNEKNKTRPDVISSKADKILRKVHLRAQKLVAAGGVILRSKENELFSFCGMILNHEQHKFTEDEKTTTCKFCLRSFNNK